MTRPIEPQPVIQLVEAFVDKTLNDAAKYENSKPLDESSVYYLHEAAAQIYALGYNDGCMAQAVREQRQRNRDATEATS